MVQNRLDVFDSNIIKWYPFKENKTIIQVGENESITNELKKIDKNITVVSNVQELYTDAKYDYVLIYGYENYDNILEKAINLLKNDGRILIIGNNEFGINNWSKYSGILKLENHNKTVKTINAIKEELKKLLLTEVNTFFAFPNYKASEIIVNEKMKVEKGHIEKYKPIIDEDDVKIFDETKVLKNVLINRPEMLEFFTNSYFIEASKNEIDTDVKLVSYNNCRNEQYRLITIIRDEIVEKIPATPNAKKQINNMKKTIEDIQKCQIDVLDYEKEGKICSKFIKNFRTLDEELNDNYNNLDYIVEILNGIREMLLKNSIKYEDCKKNVDLKGENPEKLENLHFMKIAFWDMIPKNCFYIDNKYVFFDQEWEKEYLPVEFIIYRSVINSYDLVRRINVDELLEKLGVLQYKEYFKKIDEDLRKEIIDEELYKDIYCKKIKAIDNFINDKKIDEIHIAQVEEDNRKKQKYIEELEEDNRKKQEYIESLENDNVKKQEYIKKLEERKKFFWKR